MSFSQPTRKRRQEEDDEGALISKLKRVREESFDIGVSVAKGLQTEGLVKEANRLLDLILGHAIEIPATATKQASRSRLKSKVDLFAAWLGSMMAASRDLASRVFKVSLVYPEVLRTFGDLSANNTELQAAFRQLKDLERTAGFLGALSYYGQGRLMLAAAKGKGTGWVEQVMTLFDNCSDAHVYQCVNIVFLIHAAPALLYLVDNGYQLICHQSQLIKEFNSNPALLQALQAQPRSVVLVTSAGEQPFDIGLGRLEYNAEALAAAERLFRRIGRDEASALMCFQSLYETREGFDEIVIDEDWACEVGEIVLLNWDFPVDEDRHLIKNMEGMAISSSGVYVHIGAAAPSTTEAGAPSTTEPFRCKDVSIASLQPPADAVVSELDEAHAQIQHDIANSRRLLAGTAAQERLLAARTDPA